MVSIIDRCPACSIWVEGKLTDGEDFSPIPHKCDPSANEANSEIKEEVDPWEQLAEAKSEIKFQKGELEDYAKECKRLREVCNVETRHKNAFIEENVKLKKYIEELEENLKEYGEVIYGNGES